LKKLNIYILSILFSCLLVSLFANSFSTAASEQADIGNGTVGSKYLVIFSTGLSRFQAGSTGTISAMSLFSQETDGVAYKVTFEIYSDNSGAPGALLGSSQVTYPASDTPSWKQATGLSVAITKGNYYWLGITVPSGGYHVNVYYTQGIANQQAFVKMYSPSQPNCPTPVAYNPYAISIYGSFTNSSTQTSATSSSTTSTYSTIAWQYGTNFTAPSGNSADIQTAINTALAYGNKTGGNITVWIPTGDWVAQQSFNGGLGIFIDLETMRPNTWFTLISNSVNRSVTQQNAKTILNPDGKTAASVPNCILRSSVSNGEANSKMTSLTIYGSNQSYPVNYNYVRSASRHVRISGITFLGNVTTDRPTYDNTGICISNVDGFLLDHCAVDGNTAADIYPVASKGVITNCIVTNLYHEVLGGNWGYGVNVGGNYNFYNTGLGQPTWIVDITKVWGKYDWQGINITYSYPGTPTFSSFRTATTTNISYNAGPVYMENSYFFDCRHQPTSSQWGYWVMRYCTIGSNLPNLQIIDTHGGNQQNNLAAPFASRGCEIYGCTVIGNNTAGGQYGAMLTGGSALVYNNKFSNVAQGVELGNRCWNASAPRDPEYLNNVFIWNNTYSSIKMCNIVVLPNGIVPNVNFFIDTIGYWGNGTSIAPTATRPPPSGYIPLSAPFF
jgi:hypothetical protein